jgi:hypothetical protein
LNATGWISVVLFDVFAKVKKRRFYQTISNDNVCDFSVVINVVEGDEIIEFFG